MTSSNLPAIPDGLEGLDDGLEDFDGGLQLPRLQLKHADRVFLDTATNEEYPTLVGIPLGMVRQRTMWPAEVGDEKGRPQCKSSDGIDGYPNMNDQGTDFEFPWEDFPISAEQASKDEFDRPVLKCTGCPFAEWTRNKKGKPVPPACKERYTFPFLYTTERRADGSLNPKGPFDSAGVFSLQGSGIRPARQYMSRFKASRLPLYAAVVEITLRGESRGSVEYSVPEFKKLDNTSQSDWQMYSEQLQGVKEYLKAPPRPETSDDAPRSNPAGGNNRPAAAKPTQPRQQAAPQQDDVVEATIVEETNVPITQDDEDELPF